MRAPQTSFVLPVRDAAETLDAALRSILAQSVDDFEALVVDDGSRDASLEIARSSARADPRVRVLSRDRRGIVDALNAGLEASRGEFVARMDADDIASPHRLERQLAAFAADPTLSVVDGQVRFVTDRGEVPEGMRVYAEWVNRVVEPEDFRRLRFRESTVVHPAATLRRRDLLEIGGYRDDGPEDFELWLRLHERGARFRKIPEVLVTMRDHAARATRRDPRYARDEFVRVAVDAVVRGPLRTAQRVVLWGAGARARPWLRALRDAGSPPIAIVDVDPRKIGRTRAGGVAVHSYEELAGLGADLCLVAVGSRGAEDAIRADLRSRMPTWREGHDWFMVAT